MDIFLLALKRKSKSEGPETAEEQEAFLNALKAKSKHEINKVNTEKAVFQDFFVKER